MRHSLSIGRSHLFHKGFLYIGMHRISFDCRFVNQKHVDEKAFCPGGFINSPEAAPQMALDGSTHMEPESTAHRL